jgi:hypothetical protein
MQGAIRFQFDMALRLDVDRSTFGGLLKVPAELSNELHGIPLMIAGTLKLAGEREGLAIPAQTPLVNENTLRIPISDEQIARLEEKRAGNAPTFELLLRGVASLDGSTVIVNSTHPVNLPVPLEVWLKTLDKLGFGKRRLIELPPIPARDGVTWEAAAIQIQAAAQRLASGDSGAAMTEARTALQRTLEAVGLSLGVTPQKGGPIGPFVDQITAALNARHEKKSDDPYLALADAVKLVKSCAGFASDPPHTGLLKAERVSAELALSLATALYCYFARTVQ